ncbi:MAG: hypothetical protein A3J18_01920 [Candidatus Levybacteria bacterium RIFCSPLOWO2_02_FULL_40_18]|nr:MAG: hypothetical protein A3J18_01920 [Candidatus Levybacteria bacterium RIFCSPLOWO2_02_FULL_40_18]
MKKILSIGLLLMLFISPGHVLAQTLTISPSPSSTPSPKSDYFLPYPGMLPGSPVYTLKAIRDRLIELFISDPLKKGDFYLLQADKRLTAAVALFDKGEREIAETTLSKAEKYLEKSLNETDVVKRRGQNANDLIDRIGKSSEKHKEVIMGLQEKAEGELEQRIKESYKLAEKVSQRASSMRASR